MIEGIALEYVGKVKELLGGRSFNFRNVVSSEVPNEPGVYVIFNERDEIIYVGRTKNLRRRLLGDHKRGNIREASLGRL
ncbi:MAG: GIY-YIG nuclease family protein [Candidatus Bathyarchaeia archaeon]